MKTKWPLLFVTLIALFSGCKKHVPPKSELCAWLKSQNLLICDDPRRPKNSQGYKRKIENGDVCTKPESFERTKAYCVDLRTQLIKMETRLSRCEKQRR